MFPVRTRLRLPFSVDRAADHRALSGGQTCFPGRERLHPRYHAGQGVSFAEVRPCESYAVAVRMRLFKFQVKWVVPNLVHGLHFSGHGGAAEFSCGGSRLLTQTPQRWRDDSGLVIAHWKTRTLEPPGHRYALHAVVFVFLGCSRTREGGGRRGGRGGPTPPAELVVHES